MRRRKVKRCGTVYTMDLPSKNSPAGAETQPKPAAPGMPAACPAEAPPATPIDELGIPLPEPMAPIFAAIADFQEAKKQIDRLAVLLDRIAQSPAGELYRQEMIRTGQDGKLRFACVGLRICRNKLLAAEPYCCYCPNCHPTHPTRPYPTCKSCGGRGWTTRAAFDSCQGSERQQILKMQTPKVK